MWASDTRIWNLTWSSGRLLCCFTAVPALSPMSAVELSEKNSIWNGKQLNETEKSYNF